MKNSGRTTAWWMKVLLALLVFHCSPFTSKAQTVLTDSLVQVLDSMYHAMPQESLQSIDSLVQKALEPPKMVENKGRDWSTWRPDPQRAVWLALVIPGGGQIYNRKYWKLPLV